MDDESQKNAVLGLEQLNQNLQFEQMMDDGRTTDCKKIQQIQINFQSSLEN